MEWKSNYRIEVLKKIKHMGKDLEPGRWIRTNRFQEVLDTYGDKVQVIDAGTKKVIVKGKKSSGLPLEN